MKRIFPILLGLLFLAASSAGHAQTYEDFDYSINEDGTATITGYTGPGGAVFIPPSIGSLQVSSIGFLAFGFCTNLTSVSIPGNVTDIWEDAFVGCTDLTNVTIANGVIGIGYSAFNGCTSLTSVSIPASVTDIEECAFARCTSLTSITADEQNSFYSSVNGVLFDKTQTSLVEYPAGIGGNYTIPGSVTDIGEGAFVGCTGLTNITIPNSVIIIGDGAFSGSGLTSVTIPNSVIGIADSAFSQCTSLTSVMIPASILGWGGEEFAECTSLTNVTFANGLASIGERSFGGCTGLTSITMPASITSIGGEAFDFCTSLHSVYFEGNAPAADLSVFFNDSSATVYYLPGTTGWDSSFAGRPIALWRLQNPLILNNGPSFGVQANRFGFIISWATNISVVVEACTNLVEPVWTPLQTDALTNGSCYFSDPQWSNYPGRYYRISSP